jgi:probable HAF family extracellular repeat protein
MPVNTYTTLDDPLATNGTFAWGINASGQIVGSYGDASIFYHGFLYSGGSYTTLDGPCPAARLHTASTIWVRS